MAQFRHRLSGAQGRRAAKEKERALAADGQLELKLLWTSATTRPFIRVEEFDNRSKTLVRRTYYPPCIAIKSLICRRSAVALSAYP